MTNTSPPYVSHGVLGHATRFGNKVTHLIEVRDDSPGGVRLVAVCGGIPAWIRVNSGIESSEWEVWKNAQPSYKDWPDVDVFHCWKPICPRCVITYEKRKTAR